MSIESMDTVNATSLMKLLQQYQSASESKIGEKRQVLEQADELLDSPSVSENRAEYRELGRHIDIWA